MKKILLKYSGKLHAYIFFQIEKSYIYKRKRKSKKVYLPPQLMWFSCSPPGGQPVVHRMLVLVAQMPVGPSRPAHHALQGHGGCRSQLLLNHPQMQGAVESLRVGTANNRKHTHNSFKQKFY